MMQYGTYKEIFESRISILLYISKFLEEIIRSRLFDSA